MDLYVSQWNVDGLLYYTIFLVFIFWMNAWFAFLIFKVCLEDFFAKNLCRVLVKSVLDGCAGRSLASPQSDTAVIVETPGTDQTICTVQLFQNRTWHIFFHNVKVGPSSPQFWRFFFISVLCWIWACLKSLSALDWMGSIKSVFTLITSYSHKDSEQKKIHCPEIFIRNVFLVFFKGLSKFLSYISFGFYLHRLWYTGTNATWNCTEKCIISLEIYHSVLGLGWEVWVEIILMLALK